MTAEPADSGAWPEVTRAEIIARAREIAPRLRQRAPQAEEERSVPIATIDDYRQAGLIRMIQPKR
ncbi:MAG: flavin-dependent monooxygenase, partial [Alphaproteobacteria bacterium]